MALQPEPGACIRQLPSFRRGCSEGPAGVEGRPGALSVHLRSILASPTRVSTPCGASGPTLREDIVREGLGSQVLEARRNRLSLLARSSFSTSKLTLRQSFE